MKPKPRIIVLSKDDDATFNWLSDGWFTNEIPRRTLAAQELMRIAQEAINNGKNVLDTIRLLEEAGFEIERH